MRFSSAKGVLDHITYENDSNLSASLKQIFELETQTHSSRFSESIEPTSHPKIIKKQLGKWRGLSSMTEEVKRQTFKSSKAESGCAAFITSISVNCLNHNVLLTNYNGNVFYLEPDKLDKTQADSKSTLLPPLLSLPCHPSAIEWISPATFVVNGGSNELLLFDIRTPLQKADKCTPQPAGILRFPLNYTSQSTTSGAEASFPSSPYYPPSTSTLSSPSFPYALLSSPPNVSCIAHHPHNPHIIGVGTTHGQISLLDVRTASSPLLHPTSLSTGSSCVASFVPSHSSSSVLSLMLHPVLQNTAVASTTDGNIAVLNYESSTVSPSSATPITSLASFPGVCSSLSSSISPSHPEASIAMDVEPSSSSSSMQVKKSISLSRPIRAFAMHPFLDIGVAGDETGAFTFVGPVAR
ncbi:uncharacterized protein MONOS_7953 [Monocercomonoides exilis]|uniref:uncharacterized protein n=1 Tax=Monocercomonoides exilis TaxID=2049356 RepID=UPI00355A5966|nr:hypothetical protein MONOS_7953 [Monocercomonoides exilis]|eukprot:MONOS_7953.1-p1 / transcript=MONOS_7953.1 / gene=MONOS_7953 / organism=Monocercomonoides_exilis_PA203 / gene_product=unspecified product / transcript_product=unspecified product / location=Mono_scaffold00287:14017-15403(+) / protein_length=410 / sequence_SO=supercontig / SO=protein_coding / is_pseudo=false